MEIFVRLSNKTMNMRFESHTTPNRVGVVARQYDSLLNVPKLKFFDKFGATNFLCRWRAKGKLPNTLPNHSRSSPLSAIVKIRFALTVRVCRLARRRFKINHPKHLPHRFDVFRCGIDFEFSTALCAISVLPCVASWISSGRPCGKRRSFEQQNLRASRRLLASPAARRAALLFRPKCCRTCRGI